MAFFKLDYQKIMYYNFKNIINNLYLLLLRKTRILEIKHGKVLILVMVIIILISLAEGICSRMSSKTLKFLLQDWFVFIEQLMMHSPMHNYGGKICRIKSR